MLFTAIFISIGRKEKQYTYSAVYGSNDVAKLMLSCYISLLISGHLPPSQCNAIISKQGIQDVRKYGPYRRRESEEACGTSPP